MKNPLHGKRGVVAAADTLTGLTLVAWVGGHAALGAFAARIAFRDLPRALAAATMTTVFREFDGLIDAALVLLIIATVLRVMAAGWATRADRVAFAAAVGLVALGGFEVTWVHPQIEAMFHAGRTLEPSFASLHRLSARCANLEIALTATIFLAQAFARKRS
jgi:hypothetical protein